MNIKFHGSLKDDMGVTKGGRKRRIDKKVAEYEEKKWRVSCTLQLYGDKPWSFACLC
jgi:hypothetical protein